MQQLTVKCTKVETPNRFSTPPETKRFRVNKDIQFSGLAARCYAAFSLAVPENPKLFWVDEDGDHIVLSSAVDLTEAVDVLDGSHFRLELQVVHPSS